MLSVSAGWPMEGQKQELFMKVAELAAIAAALVSVVLFVERAGARELDFLQTDPRFSGGEVNPTNPSHQDFWFYDQYQAARNAIQAAGVNVIPVTTLNLAAMTADSDAFYIPPPTNPQASVYPMTDQEISVIEQYVATDRSVIFNLGNGVSSAMDNDLFTRLGLNATQAPATISGSTSYPIPGQPVVAGEYGPVSSFNYSGTGYLSSLGSMRDLVQVGSETVIPYVEKADQGYHEGAYFFILDQNYLTNWSSETSSQQNLFMNMVMYATDPWYEHYTVPAGESVLTTAAVLPEPVSVAWMSGLAMLLLRRGRRAD